MQRADFSGGGIEMKMTRKLIETVGQAISANIKQKFPFVKNTRVSVQKINPPLKGKVGHSSVVVLG